MKARERERAIQLRIDKQWSYGAIARELNVAKSTLARWLEDLPLSEERLLELRRETWNKGEVKREQFRESMRQKRRVWEEEIFVTQKKKLKNISFQTYFVSGLMLYAAEGDKKSRAEIAFSNTDAVMVAFFARWLHACLEIPSEKLKIQLHLYENMDIVKEERYWMRELSMSRKQLCKTQVKKLKEGGFTYREPFRHGTCKLYVGGVAKKAELMLSIKAFFDTHNGPMRA